MTDSTSSLIEVPALLAERRRYEGWLAALDARRESTPKHVFERVHADYRARLERVAEQLSSHRSAIESERANVQSRLSLIAAEEQLRRDERAELELRTHVGELIGEEADRAFGSVDEVIGRLVSEKDGLAAQVAELQALLDAEATPAYTAPPVAAPPVAAPTVVPVAAPASVPVQVAAPIAAAPAPPPAPSPVVPEAPPTSAASAVVAEPAMPPLAEAPKPDAAKKVERPAAALPAAPPAAAPRENFDELAFLSSIVGKGGGGASAKPAPGPVPEGPLVERRSSEPLLTAPAGIAQDERATESLLAGVENTKRGTGERPLAANVSSNMPIVLRTAAITEQVKTLKCNECGAMNYPTEWYCERCGAELAAL